MAMSPTDFPRLRVAHLPTPIVPLARLSKHLGGPQILVKRDDCTGVATGGNKVRKLEYLLSEILGQGYDTLVTTGGLQSNHCRQTAAMAAACGLDCHLLLRRNVASDDPAYQISGNLLLDDLLGAHRHVLDAEDDVEAARDDLMSTLKRAGRKPAFIPLGGSTPLGSWGYARAAFEILEQIGAPDHIIHATGSGGTQAGLLIGLRSRGAQTPVLGITVHLPQAEQEEIVWSLVTATADAIGRPGLVDRADVRADDHYYGSYGVPGPATIEAVRLLARLEGVLLDPVYTGVAMAGLIDLVGQGHFAPSDRVLFVHTGGQAGLFAYVDALR